MLAGHLQHVAGMLGSRSGRQCCQRQVEHVHTGSCTTPSAALTGRRICHGCPCQAVLSRIKTCEEGRASRALSHR